MNSLISVFVDCSFFTKKKSGTRENAQRHELIPSPHIDASREIPREVVSSDLQFHSPGRFREVDIVGSFRDCIVLTEVPFRGVSCPTGAVVAAAPIDDVESNVKGRAHNDARQIHTGLQLVDVLLGLHRTSGVPDPLARMGAAKGKEPSLQGIPVLPADFQEEVRVEPCFAVIEISHSGFSIDVRSQHILSDSRRFLHRSDVLAHDPSSVFGEVVQRDCRVQVPVRTHGIVHEAVAVHVSSFRGIGCTVVVEVKPVCVRAVWTVDIVRHRVDIAVNERRRLDPLLTHIWQGRAFQNLPVDLDEEVQVVSLIGG